MKEALENHIKYRIERAWDTLDDARILAANNKWNSAINRLYYATYYAVMALLLKNGLKTGTHNGAKTNFTKHFIKTEIIEKELGTLYAQLFTWRQKGDYDDLFDFNENKVMPLFEPTEKFIEKIESLIRNQSAT
ncbi:MAG: HEPN domain-containing protein [Tenuifilaceae bacterium]|jgi:uncharacterized protein (UPF0332 family)|uniref:HEPN domain-containing protein n=1 Tax=Perlabentimonas gracilis TaxID=2715279 RepID=UPI0014073D48|nr:HEPN domain-containing protein [Perlabentimonas gracilis]MDX9769440.1 HEPN domain-containing protein [Tenuifilaceae bacterium]NHB70268.1 HEPN domain-containing protein [Perlabentimonas gracilis]